MEALSLRDGFFDDLVRVETRLYNALSERLRDAHGITASQFEFLRFIARHEAPRVADLARTFAVGVGATSKGVDRLEHAGWIRRVPNPHNRRSSLLALTDAGGDLMREAQASVAAILADLLAGTDVGALTEVLAHLREALEAADVGRPTG